MNISSSEQKGSFQIRNISEAVQCSRKNSLALRALLVIDFVIGNRKKGNSSVRGMSWAWLYGNALTIRGKKGEVLKLLENSICFSDALRDFHAYALSCQCCLNILVFNLH